MSADQIVRAADVYDYGHPSDRILGIPIVTHDGHVVEASMFSGIMRPKHILVISSQVGCLSRCVFCELGQARPVRNLTADEIAGQVMVLQDHAMARDINVLREPTKITIANSGEPLLNPNLPEALELLATFENSLKISTVFPRGRRTWDRFEQLALFASTYRHPVQIQISLISTDEAFRQIAAGIRLFSLEDILAAAELWRRHNPLGRKLNLSLILTDQTPCDPMVIADRFPPELFRIRLRPYIPTEHGRHQSLAPLPIEKMYRIRDRLLGLGYDNLGWASPPPVEQRHALVSNAFLRRFATEHRR